MTHLKTTLHRYRFNTSNSEEGEAYAALCAELKSTPGRGHWMHVHARPFGEEERKAPPEGETTLETEHIFPNQWNTPTHRVFDWYECIHENAYIRSGHYLDITPEMIQARAQTVGCGYCGKQTTEPAGEFCALCLNSPYLVEGQLHLTRLCDLREDHKRPELNDAERCYLLPLYIEHQTTGADSRNAAKLKAQRAEIIADRDKAVTNAGKEAEGMLWLMDHGISIGNVIYYGHTGKFCFGWRSGLSPAVMDDLIERLASFPFEREYKGA